MNDPGAANLAFFHGRLKSVVLALALFVCGCAGTSTLVVLLPDADGGGAGAISVAAAGQSQILTAPYSAAVVGAGGTIETRSITAEEARRTFARAIAVQPPLPVRFTLYFPTGSTEVGAESRAELEALFAEVTRRQAVEVEITGHTDRVGSSEDNDRLSLQRAEAVRAMLLRRGIAGDFIRTVGRGEREPLIATPDEQSEPKNRRVEVLVR